MKTKKEMLAFFLNGIDVWESFFTELNAVAWLPDWQEVDDDLIELIKGLHFIAENRKSCLLGKSADTLITNQIENPMFIEQLLHEDIISPAKFRYALFELYKFADIPGYDNSWQKIRPSTSVIDIIDKVYSLQPML